MKILSMVLPSVVLATIAVMPAFAVDESGFYIGSNLGFTRSETGTTDANIVNSLKAQGVADPHVIIKKADKGLKLLAGYQINDDMAVEIHYAKLGTYKISGKTVSGTGKATVAGYGVDVINTYPFNESIWSIARIGLFKWRREASFTEDGGLFASGQSSGVKLKLGLGEAWELGPHVHLRIEWEYYTFDDAISMLSAGLLYRF